MQTNDIKQEINKLIVNPFAVLRQEFDDWAILFNPENADAFGVNPAGVLIWKMLDKKQGLENIVNQIKENFEQVPDNVEHEILEFINLLADHGFLGQETVKL